LPRTSGTGVDLFCIQKGAAHIIGFAQSVSAQYYKYGLVGTAHCLSVGSD